ncbi:MAG: hypothetical protein AB7G39_16365 [Alphaproteobacteria bacterium]
MTTTTNTAARPARPNQAGSIERAVMGGLRLLRTSFAGPEAPSSLDRR